MKGCTAIFWHIYGIKGKKYRLEDQGLQFAIGKQQWTKELGKKALSNPEGCLEASFW